ncbi:MAG: S-layer homology domain-containing protein, partial [Oscillibacter sp.]|nr:S-layer homology domain-containing protein [Oscillibacter sp.]
MKRLLSLVMALSMIASLLTVTAGAAKFTDAASVDYVEAVDVMTGIHVIDGYADGTVQPDTKLTRGAAAKIICNMILGPETANKLTAATAPYPDVPTDHVFAGYIEYCKAEGIINGYEDGLFRPAGALTGNAFLKMLLGALGYDPVVEGYVGGNWTINVSAKAMQLGLTDGLEDDFEGAYQLTRQEAMLYAFNTLKADIVEYGKTSSVSVGDVQISGGAKAEEVPNTADKDYRQVAADRDAVTQFCEKYFPKLKCDTSATDRAGRPSAAWTFENTDIGTYSQKADKTDLSRGDNSVSTIVVSESYMHFEKKDVKDDARILVNGDEIGTYAAKSGTYIPKAAQVEIYKDEEGKVETIVVTYYTYAKIDDVTESKNGAVSLRLVDIDGKAIGTTYYDDTSNDAQLLPGYDKASYTEGAVLAVALKKDGKTVVDSYVARRVTGTPSNALMPTGRNGSTTRLYEGSVTIAGSTYHYAGYTGTYNSLVGPVKINTNVKFDQNYTVYLTKEGYVFAVEATDAITLSDLYYVVGTYKAAESGSTSVYAQTVSLADGAQQNLKLESSGATLAGPANLGEFKSDVAGVYVLTDKKAGDCKAKDGAYNAALYVGEDGNTLTRDTLAEDVKTTAASVKLTGAANNTAAKGAFDSTVDKVFFGEKTRFIAAEGKANKLSVRTATGGMSMKNNSVKVYAVYEDEAKMSAVVLYAGDKLESAVDSGSVVYLAAKTTNAVADGYRSTLYFMKDKSSSSVVIADEQARGFYTYAVNADDAYELTDFAPLPNNTDTSDEDVKGCAMDVMITENIDEMLYGSTRDSGSGVVTFNYLSFSGAKVIDSRRSDERDKDDFGDVIETAEDLRRAIEYKESDVVADLYVEDGKVTFVNVTAMEDKVVSAEDMDIPATFDHEIRFDALATHYDSTNTKDIYVTLFNNTDVAFDYDSYSVCIIDGNGDVINSQTEVNGVGRTAAARTAAHAFARSCRVAA